MAILLMLGGSPAVGQTVTITPEGQAVAAAAAPKGDDVIRSSEIRVSEYMTVDAVIQNDYVINVLQKLAIQARRNIVPSNKVTGVINATIYGVPFMEALEGLLHPNGLGYVERGEFIFVYTAEELAGMNLDPRPMETKIVHLDYIRAADAKTFVSGLLSRRGRIELLHDQPTDDKAGSGDVQTQQLIQAAFSGSSNSSRDEAYTPNTDNFALANAIVIHDHTENIQKIVQFLAEIDTTPAQVLIEATILATKIDEANAFGVDFALISGLELSEFMTFPPMTGRASGSIVTSGQGATGDATLRVGVSHGDISVLVRALDRVSDTVILSNPKLLILNRQRARIHVGERVGYLETVVVENQVLQSVKFIDTGIELDLRPYILNDGRIRLEVTPKFSSVAFNEVGSSIGGGTVKVPTETIRTVSTDVLIPDGYVAVIGGLYTDLSERTRSQVPGVGDLPLVGWAARGYDDKIVRSEILFLIKATVLKDRVVIDQGRRAEEYRELVRVGTRKGLLPWSRARQTSRLNLAAERAMREGDVDKALWNIRRSLELRPLQAEIIRMQEKLMGGPMWWPTSSVLERVINGEIVPGGRQETAPDDTTDPDAEPAAMETGS